MLNLSLNFLKSTLKVQNCVDTLILNYVKKKVVLADHKKKITKIYLNLPVY